MRGIAIAWLQGLAGAALCGATFEAALLLVHHVAGDAAIDPGYRLVRVGEVALATAALALPLALLPLAQGRVRAAVRGRLGSWLAAWGLALPVGLLVAFHLVPVDATEIQFTGDPLTQRGAGALLLAALLALVLPPLAWRLLRGREALACRVSLGAALVLGAGLLLPDFAPEPDPRRPDIFLFSVDTLRADHLGCYGYALDTSPRLDRFCEEAVVFENAIAPAPYTIASYASILTGLLQRDHRVYSNFQKASDALETLPERLAPAGYRTAALIDGSFPGTFANLDQGFGLVTQRGVVARSPMPSLSESLWSFWRAFTSVVGERRNWNLNVTTDAAERWLREQPREAALFAHFYWPFPHAPYRPPPAHLAPLPPPTPSGDPDAEQIRAYDGEIRFADDQFARLFGVLGELGRWEEAWVLFTADHGEELGRPVPDGEGGTMRYWGHSRYVFDSSLRVPLVLRPPRSLGVAPRRDETVVTTASIAATLLDAAGVERPGSLVEPLPLVPGDPYDQLVVSVSRTQLKPVDLVSMRAGEWRLIETRKPEPHIELYRYRDGEESPDLAAAEPERVAELLEKMHRLEPPSASLEATDRGVELSARERAHLEALGYLEPEGADGDVAE